LGPHIFYFYFELQEEQEVAEQPLQEELAVLLNFPPLEKAKVESSRLTLCPLHFGHKMVSEELKTNFSNSWPQISQ